MKFIFQVSTVANFLLLIPIVTLAQVPEQVVAKVFYKFSFEYDTIHPSLIKKENYVLLLGKSSSVFKSYDRILQDSEMLANYKLTGAMMPPSSQRASGEELYYYFLPKMAYLRTKLLGNYIIEKPFNTMNWKVLEETKKIENILCQKATATYMGRNYIGWFCSDFPFNAGPWKLHGLPGLIICVYDQTGRIRFDFSGFQQINSSNEKTEWDSKAVPISWEDYKKVAKAFENDPQGMMERQMHVHVTTSQPMLHKNALAPNPLINFPLEVTNPDNK